MGETTIPLIESRKAIADASGVATIELSTATSHEYWRVTNTVISTRAVGANAADNGPTFRLYRDVPSNFGLIDLSFNASDDVSDTVYEVHAGRRILGMWAGMVPGNEASLMMQGTRVMRGDRGF